MDGQPEPRLSRDFVIATTINIDNHKTNLFIEAIKEGTIDEIRKSGDRKKEKERLFETSAHLQATDKELVPKKIEEKEFKQA